MNLNTKNINTWCPGCPNNLILESTKQAIKSLITEGYKHKNFAMVAGIGCHAKIFDYINLSGIYTLHGRVIPTMLGINVGNPKLNVIGFAGDGDTYSEGLAHFISAGRYNANTTLIVHNNQSFSLTTGQVTPTSQHGFTAKSEPFGNKNKPLNPIRLALSSGATFVARCNANDLKHTASIIKQAIKHKGFSFVDIIQNCLIFNLDMNKLDKHMYKISNKNNIKKAFELADKWDYNSNKGKIPVGIFYKEKRKTLDENLKSG
ncbi:2-oxoacid:ferredoxin oxidoreductase subunit beta [Candidatus Woesearchaeota archaeon]|nr:2-oxoacid:ferredoxin oxidoreductase subunit beta [Candidatus Woesearchaeota archaeon]